MLVRDIVHRFASHLRPPRFATAAMLAVGLLAGLSGLLATDIASAAKACPNEAVRAEQAATYLPACRGYELTSPVKKNGEEVQVPESNAGQVPFDASLEGGGVAFITTGGLPGSQSGGLYGESRSRRSTSEPSWATLPLNPESRFSSSYTGEGSTGYIEYFSPNLSCGVEQTELPQAARSGRATPQLPSGELAGERVNNLYVWNAAAETAPGSASGTGPESYALVTNVKPSNAAERETDVVDGASSDCKHVIFESGYQFLGAPKGSLYEWTEGAPEETSEGPVRAGTLRVASVLPDGNAAQAPEEEGSAVSPVGGGEKGSDLNEISSDGERVFFTARADEGPDKGGEEVFVRENARTTIEVSASTTTSTPLDTGAKFQAASKDGGRVLFTANYGLTEPSSTGTKAGTKCERSGSGCDLYVYDVQTHSLTDISADSEAATGDTEGASVQSVLGISEDGSVAYFSATGRLVPGEGNSQATDALNEEANVYGYRAGTLFYVATIKKGETGTGSSENSHQEESLDALAGPLGMHYTVSRVSPDGSFLLFATKHKVREYDGEEYENLDQNLNSPDFESYEYSLTSETAVCVTCNPDRGIRPIAASGPPQGPSGGYEVNHLGYLTRTLSDSGRVFFNSVDPLVEQAKNNTVNVYEWRPDGLSGCEGQAGCVALLDSGVDSHASYFADASANGQDVYLTTQQALVPQDQDGLRDLYDVRGDGGFPTPTGKPRCEGEECQGPVGTREAGHAQASESGVGGGNPPVSTVAPPPANGVAAFTAHSVSVKPRVKGFTVAVRVSTPAKGRISVSGAGLRTVVRSVSKEGVYTLKVSLTAGERKTLERRKHVKVRLHVLFAPSSGHSSATSVAVTFT
jgi:hypothetical protein